MNNKKLKAKLKNCALSCTWIGYANSYAISTYHVLNPKTKTSNLNKRHSKSLIFMMRMTVYRKKILRLKIQSKKLQIQITKTKIINQLQEIQIFQW